MRLLLHVVRGLTSFANLHTVDGQQCETFREGCSKRGLLEDDAHWDKAMEEAAASLSVVMLRSFFAVMIVFSGLGDGRQLWGKYSESFAEDELLQVRQHSSNQNVLFSDAIVNQTLILLEDKVLEIGC
jgi:hypothetical protein